MTPTEFIRDWWPVVTAVIAAVGLFTAWAARMLWTISTSIERFSAGHLAHDTRIGVLEHGEKALRKRSHRHANVLQVIVGLTPEASKFIKEGPEEL